MVGHQGNERWSDSHVGDVASRLLHLADVPLILVNEATVPEPVSGTVVVGLQAPQQEASDPALRWALRLAEERDLRLRIVCVMTPLSASAGRGYPVEVYEQDMAALFDRQAAAVERLVADLRGSGTSIDISGEARSGHPTEQLAAAATENEAKLVVIGNHHHSKLVSFLTAGVARHLPPVVTCPVVAVPVP